MVVITKRKTLLIVSLIVALIVTMSSFQVSRAEGDRAADVTVNFENGSIEGWQVGQSAGLGSNPLEYSEDLAREGNHGALKLNVKYKGGGWDEAAPKYVLSGSTMSDYNQISYDIYVPIRFDGALQVQTIVNWPWKELGSLDRYSISEYAGRGYETKTINGTTYVVIHKQDEVSGSGQPELWIRLAGSGSNYDGGIYIDDVVLKRADSEGPPPDPETPAGVVYEAEEAELIGTEVSTSTPGYTGTGYVTSFTDDGDRVRFTVTVASGGAYPLHVRYAAPYGYKANHIVVNGSTAGELSVNQTATFKYAAFGNVLLNEGANTIEIVKNWGWFEVDHIVIGDKQGRPPLKEVASDLVNPHASQSSKALMAYLTEAYGESILSGQQTGVLSELGFIYSLTGKLPAIAAFDLDSSNDEDAIQWARYGGIVEYSWHWRAPMGGHDFYTSNTTFDVSKAVTPGTQEYELIIQDIDEMAARLKALSDANVPILWRPLHEAEGGWFWWGAKGPEPAKALYRILFDRLTNVHRLDNLIWVWTSYTSEQSPQWYPGDDVVDVIGMDKYLSEGDYSPVIADFDKLVDMAGGNKLVAYSENGPIPDPDLLRDNQVGWRWFNTWSGHFIMNGKVNEEQHLIRVYNHDYVITLDELPSADIYGRAPDPLPAPEPLRTPEPVPDGYTLTEAETGTLQGTFVDTSVKGYSGTGHVTGFDQSGDSLTVSVAATEAGPYSLLIRYAAPYGFKKNHLYVNGDYLGEIDFEYTNRFKDTNAGIVLLKEGAIRSSLNTAGDISKSTPS
ncbi:glycosyl hydrolase [Paenibacillus thermotolerans]|uniref:glycosyl hydrolase n=1 Tax=Paenibacillus thermotolerans TaxID=3027807 RepID=UPI002367F9CE|nr:MULTISPECIES: glycosyl hydrolase [unclassified Paenibacillus]